MTLALMALLGGLGAVARFLVDEVLTRWTVSPAREYPARTHHMGGQWGPRRLLGSGQLATYVVNIVGSFVLGWLAVRAGTDARLLWGTGFCGGFTTFSTASVQVARLALARHRLLAAAHLVAMATTCLAAAWLGTLL